MLRFDQTIFTARADLARIPNPELGPAAIFRPFSRNVRQLVAADVEHFGAVALLMLLSVVDVLGWRRGHTDDAGQFLIVAIELINFDNFTPNHFFVDNFFGGTTFFNAVSGVDIVGFENDAAP